MDPRISLDFTKLSINHSKEWRSSEKYMSVLQGSVVENANCSVYQETESRNEFKVKLGTNWDQVKCTYNV